MSALQLSWEGHSADASWQQIVDGCWDSFISSLPLSLKEAGRQLPLTLRLSNKPLPWSRIFHQEVTLGLPLCLAEALPLATPEAIRRAVLAHMLGIVAAFAADRIEDQQVEATPALLQLLCYVRKARDLAIRSFNVNGQGPAYDYRAADFATEQANRVEQRFLSCTPSANFEAYECLSLDKQWLAFPAAMTFARASGLDQEGLDQLSSLCLGIAMGLQLRDDATDWEDDQAEGRSWAVRLLRHAEGSGAEAPDEDIAALRERMSSAGIIVALLHNAAQHLERAASAARTLSAPRVAAWADKQAALTRELADHELKSPGHIVRWERARKQART